MTPLAWSLAGICALLIAINGLSMAIAYRRLRRRGRLPPPPAGAARISIIRPVCGIEPYVEETLASGFALDWPGYELIFCVQQASDPIVPIVERLIAAHPAIPARLLVGDERVNANPKLNNCLKGWAAAESGWVVLADSNVLMPPDYLQQLMAAWRKDTGLVCSTPLGSRPEGFWAEVECAFLNTLQARWQYVGEAVGLGFAQGKSMLWRRDMLDAWGGLRALAAEIAEDAAATKLVRAAGLHVHLVDSPFEQPIGHRRAREVWGRQIRWARLRRVTFPAFFAPEIFSGVLPPLLAGCVAAGLAGGNVAATGLGVILLFHGAEVLLARGKGWHVSWPWVAALLVRDCIIPVMWVGAWTGAQVVWRGNRMSVEEKPATPATT
ncbi:ceramide glucosyltransferase [Humitalea rosea]|uniref:Ceramide glucosyltransferase n=1 Tax=Humitalea rosea TaxID=990373 RepID=A0A2W7IGJ6_9PROT|nr:ceramide glucosyltransferase [Humitalea rosea]PZW45726.1 ceramide glucosyltransferase [Humitalea rosea]